MSPFAPSELSCYLSDEMGQRLDPLKTNAIHYKEIVSRRKQLLELTKLQTGETLFLQQVTITISGFVVVTTNQLSSNPISFSATKELLISAPKEVTLTFSVKQCRCEALFCPQEDEKEEQIKVIINIDTIVDAEKQRKILLSSKTGSAPFKEKMCIETMNIFDSVSFQQKITVFTNKPMDSSTSHISGHIVQHCSEPAKVYFRAVDPFPSAQIQIENHSDCPMKAIVHVDYERKVSQIIEKYQKVLFDVSEIQRLVIKGDGEGGVCEGAFSLFLSHKKKPVSRDSDLD
ncbi:hypothetical protein [Halalkalibacterium halodurans]|uniref:BH3114 protein n=3 Tax=Halalkalibacterium halodurans TaxID=86665 RepID=Q9K892_HALH5|nr:hypothetical protein [Halalkalibacterium halodurans]MED4126022.1 hypothetical protein [Halalkalibacterium halodurans]MED4172470.1 hypothetical protein [Halalkalibacterium halodurans]TPE69945.1 hypothetical protein AMD02_006025 [Halalkalibacterium halodurans]BAB06833.1 BH3114 [Halalkalibacterium halodurans C-125]